MGFFGRFRKMKEEVEQMSDLEKICAGDIEAYEALYRTMLLDPRAVEVSMKEAAEKARSLEKQEGSLVVRTWYQLAGALAIYEGDVKKVKKYFGKCAELSSDDDYTILIIPERAVSKAQEYYMQHLKE